METKPKTKTKVFWTAKENLIVIDALEKYIKINNVFPTPNDFAVFDELQKELPLNRKKSPRYSTIERFLDLYRKHLIGQSGLPNKVSLEENSPKKIDNVPPVMKQAVTLQSVNMERQLASLKKSFVQTADVLGKVFEYINEHPVAPFIPEPEITEDRIREIIREELEKIFGTIKDEIVKSVPTKPGSKVSHSVSTKVKYVIRKEPKKIFIYGLSVPQLASIQKTFTDVIIDGNTIMNQSVRDKAKSSDLVIVTKFAKHTHYEAMKAICDPNKVIYVSGAISMTKRSIDIFLKNNHDQDK